MKDNRPVNNNLLQFHFPLTAIVSICHRISGVVLFISMPFVLWALMKSLESSSSFTTLLQVLSQPLVQLCVWIVCVALIFHLCAGIKHLLMDIGIGETLESAKISVTIMLVVCVLLSLMTGVWLL